MTDRRDFLAAGLGAGALLATPASAQSDGRPAASEHWTTKKTPDGDVRLFIWRKRPANASKGAILWVHGSSVQSVPVFDLQPIAGDQRCQLPAHEQSLRALARRSHAPHGYSQANSAVVARVFVTRFS